MTISEPKKKQHRNTSGSHIKHISAQQPSPLLTPSLPTAAYVTFEWGWRRSALSSRSALLSSSLLSVGVRKCVAIHSCRRRCCRPTDRQTDDGRVRRANGSPRLQRPLPTQSDRRLTFGSYAAASERKSVTSLGGQGRAGQGWKRKTASGDVEGWMDGGCGSFYGSLKTDRGRGERR